MIELLKAALLNRKHLRLVIVLCFSMVALSIASSLEIVALGLLANTKSFLGGQASSSKLLAKLSSFLDAHLNFETDFRMFVVFLVCISIFKALTLFVSRYYSQIIGIKVSMDLRERYFKHIQTLSMPFFHKNEMGSLANKAVADAGQIANSVSSLFTNYLLTPFQAVTTICGCFYISWKLSLMIFICFPLLMFPIIFFTKKVKKHSQSLFINQEKFTGILLDFLLGIQTIKVYAKEMFSFKKYKQKNDEVAKFEFKAAKYAQMPRPVLHMITSLFLAGIIIIGHVSNINLAEMMVLVGLLYLFYEPVKRFAEENANIQRGVVAASRMLDILKEKPHIEDHVDAKPIKEFKNAIAFHDVWFKYEDDWVLKGMSFEIKKGQTVAFCGKTGCGKSTLINLLVRLYDPQKGSITIDGQDIKMLTQTSVKDLFAFVLQKSFFFLETVAQNMGFGAEYTLEELQEAARLSESLEFIEKMPAGFDAFLQEGGKNLSGGQQQRLSIARALLKKAPILVFDEATSHLDNISEQKIKSSLKNLKGKLTQIIIAHRLTTIENCDKIIYVEDGKIIQTGTKDELLESCPSFHSMWYAAVQQEKV
ncbi:MAG: Lipid A export ATP-binding/permease protein MsbA [Chlamydiae bacterium]|nr:Lipid A export ATP-binding/permease protein MsbA [Chlamydiota bacterium]